MFVLKNRSKRIFQKISKIYEEIKTRNFAPRDDLLNSSYFYKYFWEQRI